MEQLSASELIAAVRDAAEKNGGHINMYDFQHFSRISPKTVSDCYPGGWSALLQAAGVKNSKYVSRISDESLLEDLHKNVFPCGRIPTLNELNDMASYEHKTFEKRFGGMEGIVRRYKEWFAEKYPGEKLPEFLEEPRMIKKTRRRRRNGRFLRSALKTKRDAALCGAPLNFRGMLHEPVNEMGVVALFGMTCFDLGFVIETVQMGFPDCAAKHRVEDGKDLWRRVSIEFEFLSSNFQMHRHDPDGCDLIVCWRHDWPDCPLGVLELKSALKVVDGSEGEEKTGLRVLGTGYRGKDEKINSMAAGVKAKQPEVRERIRHVEKTNFNR